MPSADGKSISAPVQAKSSASSASGLAPDSSSKAKVCVFCGASKGTSLAHLKAAQSLAGVLHKHDMGLVYGGGTIGLMGEVASSLVSLSGPEAVEGVIPGSVINTERPEQRKKPPVKLPGGNKEGWWAKRRFLVSGKTSEQQQSQQIENQINEKYGLLTIAPSLAARKERMVMLVANAGSGSGFVALSGGFGTMDEIMEVITLHHHGAHRRRCVFFNVEGFWDHVGQWMEKAIEAGFVRPETKDFVAIRDSADGVVEWLQNGK